ncbi:MAG: ABC transporter permease [Bacteroidales bacterium]
MKKIFNVARREFVATAGTKAFIFGVLVTPVVLGLLITWFPRMMRQGPPRVEGEVAIVDVTGEVATGLQATLGPEAIARRREEKLRRANESLPPALRSAAEASGKGGSVGKTIETALGEVPRLGIAVLDPRGNLEDAKAPLTTQEDKTAPERTRLAVVVIHPDALRREAGKPRFGTYDLYVRGKLDDRVEDEIKSGLKEALVNARARMSGLDPREVEELTRVEDVTSRTVTTSGEDRTNEVVNQIMPAAFMGLLLVSVMMSGQYLLTSAIEEKSNRIVEVLLSAVSAMELMVGKILGQLVVGLLVLALYMALGLVALVSFATFGLLDPKLIVYLFVFFLLAFVTISAFMAAIGSAVSELREAQGLMTPVMVLIMIPWILWMPISRDPNSVFAVVLSFLPPVGNFVIMLRLASAAPPPLWQALLAVLTGLAGAVASLWFAAKVFRIGLLMYGKPPNFATLVRWARMA